MGTRALVRVFDEDKEIVCIYRQFDGYPEALGKEVRDFCESKQVVNGIRGDMDETKIANGMGCLAAQLVAQLKLARAPRLGSVYLMAPGTEDVGEEYVYDVRGPSCDVADGQRPTVNGFEVGRKGKSPIDVPRSATTRSGDK